MRAAQRLGLAVVAGVAVLLAPSACGGSQDAGEGFERLTEPDVSVRYPAGWERDGGETPQDVEELLNVRGPSDDNGLFARVRLLREPRDGTYDRARSLGKVIADTRPRELPEGRRVRDGEGPPGGPGAEGPSWEVLTSFTTETDDGRPVDSRLVELVVFAEERSYLLTVGGPTSLFDDLDVEGILSSLRVE